MSAAYDSYIGLQHPRQEEAEFDELPPKAPAAPLPENPKEIFGRLKPPMGLLPSAGKIHTAMALGDGASKYGAFNWRENPVEAMTYVHACQRHLDAWVDGEQIASDSNVHHLGHAVACLMIIMDASACGTLSDNRPPVGSASDLQQSLQKKL